MNRSSFLVFEGLDGSGKSTQLALLEQYLTKQDISFRHIHFPRLEEGPYGLMIAEFLRGTYGAIDKVHPKLVAMMYAGDRWDFAPTIRQWLSEGHLVVADRYVYSNIAFQCAKCQDPKEKDALREWILDLEFNYNDLPRPDLSILLQVPAFRAVDAIKADTTREGRTYLDGTQDIHESAHDFQARVEIEYEELVAHQEDFVQISCCHADGVRLSPEETHQQVLQQLGKMHIF